MHKNKTFFIFSPLWFIQQKSVKWNMDTLVLTWIPGGRY